MIPQGHNWQNPDWEILLRRTTQFLQLKYEKEIKDGGGTYR